MTTGRERMARLRWKRTMQGERQVTVWLDQASIDRLFDLHQPGETESQVVRRALLALARESARARPSVTGDTPASRQSSSSVTGDVTGDTDQARFIDLWNQGVETKDIAERLGITRTAAQSRANKLQRRGLIQLRPRGGDYPSRRAQARQSPQ